SQVGGQAEAIVVLVRVVGRDGIRDDCRRLVRSFGDVVIVRGAGIQGDDATVKKVARFERFQGQRTDGHRVVSGGERVEAPGNANGLPPRAKSGRHFANSPT